MSITFAALVVSSAPVGSSASTISGSVTIARAIATAAREESGEGLPAVADFRGHEGLGVEGVVEDRLVVAGRLGLLEDWRFEVDEALLAAKRAAESEGRTAIAAGWDGEVKAILIVADTIKPTSAEAIAEMLALGLEPVLPQRIEALSKGFKRRVGLALAVLHNPPVLILDEPTDGLDPNQKHHVRSFIRSLGSEKAIIISTHLLELAVQACDEAVVLRGGQVVAAAPSHQLSGESGAQSYRALLS